MTRFFALAALIAPLGAAAQDLPGYDRLTVPAPHRAELVAGSVWYPAQGRTYQGIVGDNPVFHGTRVMQGAEIADGTYPLVVFSHGSGGNMDNAGWLLGELARRGVMSVAVNHPGSTSGDSSPRRAIRFWERTDDLKAALDAVLADPVFGPHIDRERITAIGFSLGGAPALHLGGARFDREAYQEYCAAYGARAADCLFFAKGGVDLTALPEAFERDGRDARVSAVLAIEPGLTYAMTDASAAAITVPVRFMSFSQSAKLWDAVDVGPEGSNALGRIPGAAQTVFDPAWHFSFLGLCKPEGPALLVEEREDPICDDPEGSERETVHAQVVEAAAAFVLNQ